MQIADPLKSLAVPISSLSHDPRNARLHPERNIQAIRASLERFGQRKPVVVRRDGMVVIAGNGLMTAAKELGWTEIAAVVLEDDEITSQAYALADNRTAELANWDEELLPLLIEELIQAGEHPANMGWDDREISEMLHVDRPEIDAPPRVDEIEALREKWGVEVGQVWSLGRHRLLCGDSTKAPDVALLLAGERPGLMVTDPPYGVEYDAAWRGPGGAVGKVTNDDRADWSASWDLFPGAVAYVWHSGLHTAEVFASLEVAKFSVRAQIIWAKSSLVMSRGHYHWQHEPCFYAVRDGETAEWIGDRKQTTVWQIDKPQSSETGHSTQKPVECMARPIRNHAFKMVYEPFLGSGSTLIACEQLGRECRAIEIEPGYVAVAIQRWADATGGTPIKVESTLTTGAM